MGGAQRIAALAGLIALGGCTMIGAEEVVRPDAPGPVAAGGPVAPRAARSASRSAEPPSRGGNMERYEQSGATYRVLDTSEGYDARGVASWYGPQFHGRPTSSGERYDMNMLTAAHRTLPLPSWVEVTNLANGRSVVVRVNDRGPFHDTDRRIIDVSYAAAVALGMERTGTASVRVRAVAPYQVRVQGD